MDRVPSTIGRFEIGERLTRSRAGGLYLARDPRAAAAAQKFLVQIALVTDTAARQIFLEEAGKLRAAGYDGIGEVVDLGEADHFVFVAFRHHDGNTLASLIAQRKAIAWPLDEKIGLVAKACRDVSVARRAGITHLSLTPGTIWVTDPSRALSIVSLDWPRVHSSAGEMGADADERSYIAPECLAGRERDEVCDVFTMATVLFELLEGGQRAAEGSKNQHLLAFVARGRSISREERVQSVDAFADALNQLLAPSDRSGMRIPAVAVKEIEPPPAEAAPEASNVFDQNVQFTVYRPATLEPGHWQTLLAFAHLAERRPDAEADEPEPAAEVARQATALLGDLTGYREHTEDSLQAVQRDGELTFVPYADGVEFNPPRRSFLWTETVHREEFRLRAHAAMTGRAVHGRLTVYVGAIVIAEVGMSFKVGAGASPSTHPVSQSARPYRKIFASYSHRDRAVVQEYSAYARALGDRYLQDVIDLRSGERWQPGLEDLIRQADVFQLFWSWNALESQYVQQECQFALGLKRPTFVRPVYWDDPLPARGDVPSEALRQLHFERIRSQAAISPRAVSAPRSMEDTGAMMKVDRGVTDSAQIRIPPAAGESRDREIVAEASPLMHRWTATISAIAAIAVIAIMIPVVSLLRSPGSAVPTSAPTAAAGPPPDAVTAPTSEPATPTGVDSRVTLVVPAEDFGDVKVLVVAGDRSSEVDALLSFEPDSLVVRGRSDRAVLRTLPYRSIAAATYVRSRRPRGQDAAGAFAVPENVGGPGVVGGARHWLTLQTASEFLIIRLVDRNVVRVINLVEARMGRTVVRSQSE